MSETQTEPRQIRITCRAAESLPLDAMSEFQGQLKSLSKVEAQKLRSAIITDGFSFPFFIWKRDGQNYIIDGHQRFRVLRQLRAEGWTIPDLPICWIEADDEVQAKRKLLEALSQYGRESEETLYEFLHETGLAADWLRTRELIAPPQVDVSEFDAAYMTDSTVSDTKTPQNPHYEKMALRPFEHYDYIVFFFRDSRDFLAACDRLKLAYVDCGPEDCPKIGLGRVLDGKQLLALCDPK